VTERGSATKIASSYRIQHNRVSQLLEATNVVLRELGGGQTIEVVSAKVLIRYAVTQDVVHGDQEAVRDGDVEQPQLRLCLEVGVLTRSRCK
jgi:hypothetical protein